MFFSSGLLRQQLQGEGGKELEREERGEGDTSNSILCPPPYVMPRGMSKFEKFLCVGSVC